MIPSLLLALCAGTAHAAIVNVLDPTVGDPEEGFTGEVSGSIAYKTGNEESTLIKADAGLLQVDGDHTLMFIASQKRSTAFGELTGDTSFAHLRYLWRFNDPWTTFAFVQGYQNPFRDLQVRSLAGGGIERRLWRTDTTEAALATSMMVEYEVLNADVDDDQGLRVRNSSFFLIAIELDDDLTLGSTTFFQPIITDPADFRLLEEASIKAKLGEYFSWTAKAKLEYDTRPPADVESLDLSVASGLVFSW